MGAARSLQILSLRSSTGSTAGCEKLE